MKRFSVLSVVCFAFLLCLPFFTKASPLAFTTERLSGQDRIETALSIAQKGWDSAQTVILCEFTSFSEPIAAAPFAAGLDAPILLTGGKSLDKRVAVELERLQPEKVILVGGQALITTEVEADLDSMSISWQRIGGKDRFETSVLLAREISSDSVIIASGDDFPDALSAASYAGAKQIPILLTSKTLPESVKKYLEEAQPGHIIVVGGEGVIPSESLTGSGFTIETRLGGKDRYATNAEVVQYMQNVIESDNVFMASGLNFPDAVAGTTLASKIKAPLLLTAKEDIPPAVYKILREHMKVEPSAVKTGSGLGKITANGGLNLRDTPSAGGKVLLTVPEGTSIEITGQQGQWYQTAYHGKNGWVSASYVNVTISYQQGKITASGGLNLRESPSTSAGIVLTIPEGATVTITESKQDWYKVAYRGSTGWVFAEYVTIKSGNSSGSDSIDLSPNGLVYILGGSGVISAKTEKIIQGKDASKYPENLKDFPSLPSSLSAPDSSEDYNPAQEVLIDPFAGIPEQALSGKKIILDPGHGGPDTGAIGPGYTFEKDNNLAIALYLKDILTEAGATVTMTRTTDDCVAATYSARADLQARVALANSTKGDMFISIHNNALTNPDHKGTTVYYSGQNPKAGESAKLAGAILDKIIGTVNTYNKGVRDDNFYVVKNTTMTSVLIEAAYISNPEEEERLKNPIFQKNLAAAVFQGIYDYLNQ